MEERQIWQDIWLLTLKPGHKSKLETIVNKRLREKVQPRKGLKGNYSTFQPHIHLIQHQTSVYRILCENGTFLWPVDKKIRRKVPKKCSSVTSQGTVGLQVFFKTVTFKTCNEFLARGGGYFLAPHVTANLIVFENHRFKKMFYLLCDRVEHFNPTSVPWPH
jgi:hypothetical protein